MPQFGSPQNDLYIGDPRHRRLALLCAAPPVLLFVITLVLISFTSAFDGLAFGAVSWALLVAIGQFAVAIIVGHIYIRRAEDLEGSMTPGGNAGVTS